MNLSHLKDQELLTQTKRLVQQERLVLTQVLHHLREVERRKLFCDLGFQGLFEYAVRELHYSEGQAGRRIQAMRLLKELPEVEEKIKTGALSLSNLAQAQSYFREIARHPACAGHGTPGAPRMRGEPTKPIQRAEKLEILKTLENKSAREAQKVILKLQPNLVLSKERERPLSEEHTEVRFVINSQLKAQLEEVRSLLGAQGATMGLAELVATMAKLSTESLKAKKFGKQRAQKPEETVRVSLGFVPSGKQVTPTSELNSKYMHYVPREAKYEVWQKDRGKCASCGTQRNLQLDHIQPVALGGSSSPENLRLLCFNCNQRRAIKTFGINQMQQYH